MTVPPQRVAGRFAPNLRVLAVLIASTLLAYALLIYRIRYTQRAGHLSLFTDILLGWSPLLPGLGAMLLAQRKSWVHCLSYPCWGVWFLFLPNSPYLITELIHLTQRHQPGPGGLPPTYTSLLYTGGPIHTAPEWMDLLLLSSIALCGVLLTLTSLRLFRWFVKERVGRMAAIGMTLLIVPIISFGVALGRFERLNSWDVAKRPRLVLERIERATENPAVLFTTLALSAMLGLADAAVTVLGKQND